MEVAFDRWDLVGPSTASIPLVNCRPARVKRATKAAATGRFTMTYWQGELGTHKRGVQAQLSRWFVVVPSGVKHSTPLNSVLLHG